MRHWLQVPGTILVEYADPESGLALAQGEQVFVRGRVNRTLWNVETAGARKQELLVPAVYVVLRVPDLDAINLSLVYATRAMICSAEHFCSIAS